MSNLRAICRPYSLIYHCRGHSRLGFAPSGRKKTNVRIPSASYASSPFVLDDYPRMGPASWSISRRTLTGVSNWNRRNRPTKPQLQRDADEEKKSAYRRLAQILLPRWARIRKLQLEARAKKAGEELNKNMIHLKIQMFLEIHIRRYLWQGLVLKHMGQLSGEVYCAVPVGST